MNATTASLPSCWRYAALGLPLAMVALPVYVQVPQLYGDTLQVPLGILGLVLFLTRLVDTVQDPWLGRLSDRLSRRGSGRWRWLAAVVLMAGLLLLFNPPMAGSALLVPWLGLALLLVYSSYSLLQIDYLAWGGAMAPDGPQLASYSSARESAGVLGVVLATGVPALLALPFGPLASWQVFGVISTLVLIAGCALTFSAGQRPPTPDTHPDSRRAPAVWRVGAFRRLAGLYAVNCLANALPATLVLFFIKDVLQLPDWSALFLILYFGAALAGMPLWLALNRRWGLERSWQCSLVAATLAFSWTPWLGSGDGVGYAVICVLAGLALGGDLALPPALLACTLERNGIRDSGPFYGWWTLLAKAGLALAAGVALPALEFAGYRPGAGDGLVALTLLYAGLPCLIKVVAAVLLQRLANPSKESVHANLS